MRALLEPTWLLASLRNHNWKTWTPYYRLLADFQRTAQVLNDQYQLEHDIQIPKIQLAHKIANLPSCKLNSSAAYKLEHQTFTCVYTKSPRGAILSPPLCGPPHHTEWPRHDVYTTSKYQAQKIAFQHVSSIAQQPTRSKGPGAYQVFHRRCADHHTEWPRHDSSINNAARSPGRQLRVVKNFHQTFNVNHYQHISLIKWRKIWFLSKCLS